MRALVEASRPKRDRHLRAFAVTILDERLAQLAGAVDAAGLRLLSCEEPYQGLYEMLRYHLGWQQSAGSGSPGKRLRPAICLLVAEAVGGDWRPALPAATAVELVHNFSLIHDDIQDRSPLRRHRPTVWARWGVAQGINAGDALLIIAFRTLVETEPRLPVEVALGAFGHLCNACRALCEGQYLDLLWEGQATVLVDQYLEMIERKTARLFRTAAELGAYCAGTSDDVHGAWAAYGTALGVGFQAADDLLGVWGPEAATGKTADLDVAARKKTLPIVLGLAAPASAESDRLRELFGLGRPLSREETMEATTLLTALGAREATAEIVRQYEADALRSLEELASACDVTVLRALTETMLPEMR